MGGVGVFTPPLIHIPRPSSTQKYDRFPPLATPYQPRGREQLPLTDAFGDLYCLVRVGDRLAACGAAIKVQNLSLQACVTPAASAEAADDKIRALAIVLGWAWSRVPALAAVLKAAMAQEGERWGGDVSGRA